MWNLPFAMQGVAILDVNETSGENTRREFQEKFPNQTIVFRKCDISSKDQMKGNKINENVFECQCFE